MISCLIELCGMKFNLNILDATLGPNNTFVSAHSNSELSPDEKLLFNKNFLWGARREVVLLLRRWGYPHLLCHFLTLPCHALYPPASFIESSKFRRKIIQNIVSFRGCGINPRSMQVLLKCGGIGSPWEKNVRTV